MQIAVVLSNKPDAKGLLRARDAGIATECIENSDFEDRQAFDRALAETIDNYAPDLLILAGFMRILSTEFVAHYSGRILNIHPSLLPAYPGLHTHQRAIDNHDAWHGCTVHFVTDELDGGPPVIQARVPVRQEDTAETLAARVLRQEHKIYPIAADLLAGGRIRCENGTVYFDDAALEQPIPYSEKVKKGSDPI
jgi:phosphoribosylglycinamide formyltransferase-1